jgi:uncharacterized protein (TIGR02680 family)
VDDRWRLNRAGIINVFQYGIETLHFRGGRLLLRGVNGSGKSTAMNMLLPFLLDADVRRIDAAGEQSGVLRSWMLSGRDQPQPTGYLWLEVANGDDHLTFGCGIKASRTSDTVNHWWFVTERRPGIDLDLVPSTGGGRTPLSMEQLKGELGPSSVWPKEQRPAYRAALHGRLYGGANLDQHLRLLHIVRNPRVGDRVDVDLPNHLQDALPQLSNAAIDDAATPLEQLEEHRANVAQLASTVRTLDALVSTYRQHARWELRSRADDANRLVAAHRQAESAARKAVADNDAALTEAEAIAAAIDTWSAATETLDREIAALKQGGAYQSHIQLDDKRKLVAQLDTAAAAATSDVANAVGRVERAVTDLGGAEKATHQAERQTDVGLTQLLAVVGRARLAVSAPARPIVDIEPSDASATLAAGESGTPPAPARQLDDLDARASLRALRAAAQVRSDEVAETDGLLASVDAAANELAQAERRTVDAEHRRVAANERRDAARGEARHEADAWSASAGSWDRELADHIADAAHLSGEPSPTPIEVGRVATEHAALLAERRERIDAVRHAHAQLDATLSARLRGELARVGEADELVAELAARTLPDPPSAPWQEARSDPSLAELIDFSHELDDRQQAALEGALEASGLLAAELTDQGLVSRDGQLVVAAGAPVSRSLDSLVTVDDARDRERADRTGPPSAAIRAILGAISIDAADLLDDTTASAVVTLDGRFRVGPLRGRHVKGLAEHIGITARRAALERRRVEAAQALAAAQAVAERTRIDLDAVAAMSAAAHSLHVRLPPTDGLVAAITRLDIAEESVARAEAGVSEAIEARDAAERTHAQRFELVRRRCAELDLPHDRAALRSVAEACRDLPPRADHVGLALDALANEVRSWMAAARRWREAESARAHEDARRQRALSDFAAAQAELATLEDRLGADAREVLSAIGAAETSLSQARHELREAHKRHGPAQQRTGECKADVARARTELDRSEATCAAALSRLQAAVAVPGLLAAAHEPAAPSDESSAISGEAATDSDLDPLARMPGVPSTAAGLRTYAAALLDLVPEAPHTPADNVRNALRSRRPDLGAGWDAQDRNSNPALPLEIEVVGPLGTMPLARAALRAAAELRTSQGLLTSQQDTALRNLLQGLIADEVAEKMHAATELVDRVNARLKAVRTTHGVGVSLRWRRRDDLTPETNDVVALLATRHDLRSDPDADARLVAALSRQIDNARRAEPEATYAALIARIFDYRSWHRMAVMVHRPGGEPERLRKGTALSEGEKKMVSYQPLFAAVAASCDGLAEAAPEAPRFLLLDDAFAKVSEDNHAKLFGLLVDLDLDFIATSERLWGTHSTVPELAITEVVRDADAGVIVLEHSYWDGTTRTDAE